MNPLQVTATEGADPVTAAVLSSLPKSFTPAATVRSADAAVVLGVADWPTRVQQILQAGAAVILVQPEPADLSGLCSSDGCVVIDTAWAANPAIPAAAEHVAAAAAQGGTLLECQVITGDRGSPGAALLDLAALIRSLFAPLAGVQILHHDGHGFVASGTTGTIDVALSVHRSSAVPAQARVRLLTATGGVEVTLPDPATARPAEIAITTPDGRRLLPTLWESSRRATWRRLATVLATHASPPDLGDFAADQAALAHPVSLLNPH